MKSPESKINLYRRISRYITQSFLVEGQQIVVYLQRQHRMDAGEFQLESEPDPTSRRFSDLLCNFHLDHFSWWVEYQLSKHVRTNTIVF